MKHGIMKMPISNKQATFLCLFFSLMAVLYAIVKLILIERAQITNMS